MGILPASFLALIYALAITNQVIASESSPSTYLLGDDITAVVPACAQSCFVSFLAANFPISTCSTSPSLECLCTHKSSSGYTAGEGVLQCIIAEENAYNMCAGLANALPNTHSVLRASIIIESRTSESVATTTDSSSEISSTLKVTSVPSTLATSAPPQTTSDTLATSTSGLASPTAPASAQDSPVSSVPGTGLSSPQLAGIIVASAVAALLAIVAIAIAVCMRRRRRKLRERTSDSNSIPFQHSPSTDKKHFPWGAAKRNSDAFGTRKIAPPIPDRNPYDDPTIFSRWTLKQNEIGMAVTSYRSSRLLPEKPKLRVYVPPAPIAKNGPPPASFPMTQSRDVYYNRRAPSRDSSMTQFEEDNTPYTPYSYEAENAIYYPQSNVNLKPSQPIPAPVTPPGDGGSLNAPNVQDIRGPTRSFSQPLQSNTATSSVYSGRSSPQNSSSNYQNNRSQQQQPYKVYAPYRPTLQPQEAEPATNFSNQVLFPPENTLIPAPLRRKSYAKDRRSADLSPVAESPVSYPKIPKLSPTFEYSRPPQPNFQRQQDPQPWLQAERRGKESTPYHLAPSAQTMNRESGMSTGSTSSSLLEKRRGKEQADALILKGPSEKSTQRKNGWRVMPNSEEDVAHPGWKPQTGRSFTNLQSERGQVPMSPSPWELTPKKMGDDLFLTVR